MHEITYTEIQQHYGKCLQKFASHNSMASNNNTHALPKNRQNAKMVTQAWTWAELPTTKNHVHNSTQTTEIEKKILQISNLGHCHHFRLTRTRPRAVSTTGAILLHSTLISKVPSYCSQCTTEMCSGSVQEKLNFAMNTVLLKDQQKYCYRLVGSHVACLHNAQPTF